MDRSVVHAKGISDAMIRRAAREHHPISRPPEPVIDPSARTAMTRDPLEDPAILASLDAADIELATDLAAESDASPARKPKLLDPLLAALFTEPVESATARVAEAARHWREATAREAPSIERIATAGTLCRVDTDLVSGYLAVVTPEETWRAFVDRPQLATILALLLRRPLAAIEAAIADGPATLKPTEPTEPTEPATPPT
jgi:hypothetical protein